MNLGTLLRHQLASKQPKATSVAPTAAPEVIDVSAWYEQHIALLHQFLHCTLRTIGKTPAKRDTKLLQRLDEAHAELTRHAALIAGDAIPTVLSRDGKHPIPYERLAEARAKIQVLTAELAQTRAELTAAKIEGWRPEFDVMSPQQEELAMQFCQEIAGARGQPGNPPDPVRLLEMAQALYEAERADCMPNAGEAS